jgi:hypothetical protein
MAAKAYIDPELLAQAMDEAAQKNRNLGNQL